MNRLIEEGKGRLLRDRLEELKLRVAKGVAVDVAGQGKHAEETLAVVQWADDERSESLRNELFGEIPLAAEKMGFGPVGRLSDKPLANRDRVESQVAFHRLRIGRHTRRKHDQGRTAFGEKGRKKVCTVLVGQVKRAAVRLEDMLGSLDDEAVEFSRRHSFREGSPESVEEVKDPSLLLMDLGGTPLELAHAAPRTEEHDA